MCAAHRAAAVAWGREGEVSRCAAAVAIRPRRTYSQVALGSRILLAASERGTDGLGDGVLSSRAGKRRVSS